MTLVRRNDENTLPSIMLSVQQQNYHHHHNNLNNNLQTNRSNVIVSTGGLSENNSNSNSNNINNNNNNNNNLKISNCKRAKMYQTTPYGTHTHQPASVARRNARERNRVKQVNNGFATLRQHIPQSVAQALGGNTAGTHGGSRAGSKKLSKVETLRMAVEYIRSLQRLLDDSDDGSVSSPSSSSTCGSRMELHSEIHLTELHSPSSSTDLHGHQHVRQNPSPSSFVPPPCSEASSSPTPSFVSETSSAGSQGYASATLYTQHSDAYDNYEPMSPEDEELLDVISWWQQSQ